MRGRLENFEPQIEAHWGQILQLATRLTGSQLEGEEITQQTFYLAFRAWSKFEGRSEVLTWLIRIAINAYKVHAIKNHRRQASPLDDDSHPGIRDRDMLELNEQTQRIKDAMRAISPKQRTVLTLFCLDGLSHESVAEILNCPVGTVWSRLHSARAALAQKLSEEGSR